MVYQALYPHYPELMIITNLSEMLNFLNKRKYIILISALCLDQGKIHGVWSLSLWAGSID